MEENVLDLRGLKCPLPALMSRRALARLEPGARITILTTDPLAVVDIPHMCGEEGHCVESVVQEERGGVFRIRRRSGS